jgi:hypothetical protein
MTTNSRKEFDEEYSNEDVFEEMTEEDKIPLNWKGSVYDDDEFEKDLDWESKGIYTEKKRTTLKPVNLATKDAVVETTDQPKNEVPDFELPKGGWQVKKVVVVESVDYPTLSTEKLNLQPKKPQLLSSVKKWKKSPNFFAEDTHVPPPIADEFTVVQKKSPKRSPPEETRSPPKAAVPQDVSALKNTRMCNYMGNCRKKEGCSFAHSLEEWQPPTCRFQENCKHKATCNFKHASETKNDFLARLRLMKKN